MKKRLLLAAATTAAILGSYAQINSPASTGYLFRAVEMYDDGNYYGCLDQLKYIDTSMLTAADAETLSFYRACATIHTDKPAAIKLLEDFIDGYPQSMRRFDALMALGDCYYGSDYAKALDIYNNVYTRALTSADNDRLSYHRAYCMMELGDYDKALPLLDSLSGSAAYANASTFYRGYIAYLRKDYSLAEQLFSKVDTSTSPGVMADFYLSQIYFMRDDYDQSYALAKRLLRRDNIAEEYVAEANRIAGESAYQLGDDSQAVNYLERYVSMIEVPLNSSLYILGTNAYNSGQYQQAIDYLKPVTEAKDAMGQCAYLYLGQAYMHLGDYTEAAMALNRALNMDYDQDVRETAYYNYAVASVSGGKAPFANTVKIFSDFLRIFPKSEYAPDVQEYIITSYITDNNYAAALQSINEMTSPSQSTLAAKQRVLYVLGNKSLAKADYVQALKYLQEAATLDKYDASVAREVQLALGEVYYRQENYPAAVAALKKYISKAPAKSENMALAHYDLGYALFAQKKYADAAQQFETLIKTPGNLSAVALADAYNRLGDCRYFAKDFGKAEEAYDRAYTKNPSSGDYSLFQKALMAGYLRDYNNKIDILKRLQTEFASSSLLPQALLETTESYIQLGNNAKAIEVYQTLVDRYPTTVQGRQGYLQMALVKLNTGDRAGAIADYRTLISRFPTSDEAQQAVEQMKRISAADGTLPEFTAFLKSVDNAPQIDASEIETLTFENAEKEYLTDHRIDRIIAFVNDYPQSNMRARALSYIVEERYGKGDTEEAYTYAETLASQYPSSSYAQQALIVKAEIEETTGRGNLAMRTWSQLAESASTPATQLRARMGVLRNGREEGPFDDVIAAADAVLTSGGVGADDIAEARYSRALALEKKGDNQAAREAWQQAADRTDLLYGIQSAYRLGESFLAAGDNANAEKWAKAVANADSPHTYWIARGFILLSDIYNANGDNYKARQYLEAVRDNYTGGEQNIFQMIDKRLK